MGDYLAIARRHLTAPAAEEKQAKQEKGASPGGFPCFSSPPVESETVPARPATDPVTALAIHRLLGAADDLVERLGVDGNDSAIQEAARMVVSAHATYDVETVHFACVEFELTVRAVAAREKSRESKETRP